MGIEPTYPAWKAGVLPLNHTCIKIFTLIEEDRYMPERYESYQSRFLCLFLFLTRTGDILPRVEGFVNNLFYYFSRNKHNLLCPVRQPSFLLWFRNRGDRIRTCDLLLPKQALHQAEPHPEPFVLQKASELYSRLL